MRAFKGPCALGTLLLCSMATAAQEAGHLLIIGGGLRADNGAVFARLFELIPPEESLCIVATASATPRESAENMGRELRRQGPKGGEGGLTIQVIELTRDDPSRADDAGAADEVRGCGSLYFTGGDQSRITRVFRPRGRETAVLAASREVLARGGTIAGTSAGAAMMSDPMITGGSSRDWLERAADGGPGGAEGIGAENAGDDGDGVAAERLRLGPGLGFFPYGIVDQHFLARGRLGRLVVALEATGVQRGYGVADDRAMHVDLSTGRIEAIGAAAVVAVDVGELKRDGGWRNIRLSLLGHGDVIDGKSGEVLPAARRQPSNGLAAKAPAAAPDTPGPWSRNAVLALARQLAAEPELVAIAADERLELRLSVDDRTRVFICPEDDGDVCILDMRLDMVVR